MYINIYCIFSQNQRYFEVFCRFLRLDKEIKMNKTVNRFSQVIAAVLIFTISYMFCSCPVNLPPEEDPPPRGPSPLTPGVGTPRYFYIDSDGNYENEGDGSGRTGLIVEDNRFAEGVLVYSDDTGTDDRVGFVYEDSIVSMFFKKGSNFPYRMAITKGSDAYYAYVSSYDTGNNTYNITFLNNGFYEMVDHVVLNENIFSLYEDNSELSISQNRRMANMIVAMGVWGSLYATFDKQLNGSYPIVFSRSIWGSISRGVAKVFATVAVVAVVVATVVAPVVSFIDPCLGMALAKFSWGIAETSTGIAIAFTFLAFLFDKMEDEDETQPPPVQLPTVLVTLPYENNRSIKYNSNGNHEEFHIPLGSYLLVKFYIPNVDYSKMITASLYDGFMFVDEPSVPKGNLSQNMVLFSSPPVTVEETSSSGEFVVKFKRNDLTGCIGDGKVNFGFFFFDENKQPIDLSVNDYTGGFNFRLSPEYELKTYKNMVVIHFCMNVNCPDIPVEETIEP